MFLPWTNFSLRFFAHRIYEHPGGFSDRFWCCCLARQRAEWLVFPFARTCALSTTRTSAFERVVTGIFGWTNDLSDFKQQLQPTRQSQYKPTPMNKFCREWGSHGRLTHFSNFAGTCRNELSFKSFIWVPIMFSQETRFVEELVEMLKWCMSS